MYRYEDMIYVVACDKSRADWMIMKWMCLPQGVARLVKTLALCSRGQQFESPHWILMVNWAGILGYQNVMHWIC